MVVADFTTTIIFKKYHEKFQFYWKTIYCSAKMWSGNRISEGSPHANIHNIQTILHAWDSSWVLLSVLIWIKYYLQISFAIWLVFSTFSLIFETVCCTIRNILRYSPRLQTFLKFKCWTSDHNWHWCNRHSCNLRPIQTHLLLYSYSLYWASNVRNFTIYVIFSNRKAI